MTDESQAVAPIAALQHKIEHSFLLGCGKCVDRSLCGGLQIQAPALSCLDHCACVDPNVCKLVCPRNPKSFVERVQEVNGFELANIERRPALAFPDVPKLIPLMYRSLPLARPIDFELVAIPFSEMYRRKGKVAELYTREELETKFRLKTDTRIVLSGVENDRHVEQWWGSIGRRDVVRGLKELGVVFATTPNFSVMADVPRHDNMHAIKRIALVWSQLHDAQVPTALHLNGRTDHDFFRFREFLQVHEEIEAISFEFTTGTANKERGQFFVDRLIRLSGEVRRPLILVLRGGIAWAAVLSPYYAHIIILETVAFVKTVKRKRAVRTTGINLGWQSSDTPNGAPLDELLAHNLEAVSRWVSDRRQMVETPKALKASNGSIRKSNTNDKSVQLRLL
jgi:hypothetical protein